VRCWNTAGVDGPGRSLTIVRLDTGEVLMNFRGATNEGPPNLLAQNRAKVVDFDSPITGVPVAFPGRPGEIANRVYVGDADGTLWRIDVAKPDPIDWKVELAWDAYSLTGDDSNVAEPVQTPPVVSLDPLGNHVILFATGDQDRFFDGNSAISRVWSLTEKLSNGVTTISNNWVQTFTPGVRVTGPLSLFNGAVYFSTFSPSLNSAAACSDGFGTIWGLDYRLTTTGVQGAAPRPRLPIDPAADTCTLNMTNCDTCSGGTGCHDYPASLVFGVGVTQTPTCYEEAQFSDPYMGGMRTAISAVGGGDFQLVFQTGKNAGTNAQNAKTKTVTRDLPRPRETTRVDSWASAIE
jgi:type IV pilus assembly protein PilY1